MRKCMLIAVMVMIGTMIGTAIHAALPTKGMTARTAREWLCCVGGTNSDSDVSVNVIKPSFEFTYTCPGVSCAGDGHNSCEFFFTGDFVGIGVPNKGAIYNTGPVGADVQLCGTTPGVIHGYCSAQNAQPGPYLGTVELWQDCTIGGGYGLVDAWDDVVLSVPAH